MSEIDYETEVNPAMRGAYRKGRQAFENGLYAQDNPYTDCRQDNNRITWSRAFRKAWFDGWMDAKEDFEITKNRTEN